MFAYLRHCFNERRGVGPGRVVSRLAFLAMIGLLGLALNLSLIFYQQGPGQAGGKTNAPAADHGGADLVQFSVPERAKAGLVSDSSKASAEARLKSPGREALIHPPDFAAKKSALAVPVDIITVLDRTGSMKFDTICYGCWARCGDNSSAYGNNGPLIPPGECTAADRFLPFPDNGRAFFYDFDGPVMQTLRTGEPVPQDIGGNDYIIIEAEFYSYNNAHDQFPPAWSPEVRVPGRGYWAMQRNRQARAYSIDGYGENYQGTTSDHLSGMVRHHPYIEKADNGVDPYGKHYTLNDALNNDLTPRLEYDFKPTWAGTTYIYLRTQYFYRDGVSTPTAPHNQFFWAIGDDPNDIVPAQGGADSTTNWYPGDYWAWVKLDAGTLTANTIHTLKIWASSTGYGLDRIIITDQNIANMGADPVSQEQATPGSAQRLARDPCNPIFGRIANPPCTYYQSLTEPTNSLDDPLFSGLQPMRGAQQGVRNFVERLDPQLDQAGFVSFSADATQEAQLECIRASQKRAEDQATQKPGYPNIPGTEYDELTCFDPDAAAAGTLPISYTNVFIGVENAYPPGGNTDIADGLRRALHMLGIITDDDGVQTNDCLWNWDGSNWEIDNRTQPDASISDHCARTPTSAVPLILLVTDGVPTNNDPGDNSDCIGAIDPPPYPTFPNGDKKYECIMYYAEIAARHGVSICPIGLGPGVDIDLLGAIAAETNGQAFFTNSYTQLDQILEVVVQACSSDASAALSITKSGPATARPGGLITYTLTLTNSGPVTATGLVVTDAIPAGASYVTGGTKIGGVVSWTVTSLAANGGITQTTFSVTATQTITNSDYGVNGIGGPPVVTVVQECISVLQNGSFEDGIFGDPNFFWQTSGVVIHGGFPYVPPNESSSFGILMQARTNGNQPALYQEFEMPAGVNDQSTARLTLFRHLNRLPNDDDPVETRSPGDQFRFFLRDENGLNLTTALLIATGADDPDGDSDYSNANWVVFPEAAQDNEVFSLLIGNPQALSGQTVQAYFEVAQTDPNDFSTDMALDIVKLEVCTELPSQIGPPEIFLPIILKQ